MAAADVIWAIISLAEEELEEELEEVEAAEGRISDLISRNNLGGRSFRQLRHQIKPPR